MRNIIVYGFFFVLLSCTTENLSDTDLISYPESRTVPFIETLHGTEISDPYRWLEDFTGDEANAWAEKQNAFTQTFIKETAIKTAIKEDLSLSLIHISEPTRPY